MSSPLGDGNLFMMGTRMPVSYVKKPLLLCLFLMLGPWPGHAVQAEAEESRVSGRQEALRDGQIRRAEKDRLEAWDEVQKQWVGIELFWRRFSERRGGLTWGSRTEYPRYSKVRELDTMIINLPKGPCMMEFFHGRWRRANNVRRWSEEFDEYGGCPYVFD